MGGYTYSASAERFKSIARRTSRGKDVEVELHIGTVIVRIDGEEVLEFDLNHVDNLEALAEDLRED